MIMRIRTVIQGIQGLPGLSTVYAKGAAATPVNADGTDMLARVRAFWLPLAGSMPTGVTVSVNGQVDIINEADGSLAGSLSLASPAAVNGSGGSALPIAAAIVLQEQTGVIIAGRRLRGRSFISPVSTGTSTNGFVANATGATIIAAALTTLTGATTSAPVVWHRPNPKGAANGSVSVITAFAVGPNFGVLRSRRDS
jgi:hypothetical protein